MYPVTYSVGVVLCLSFYDFLLYLIMKNDRRMRNGKKKEASLRKQIRRLFVVNSILCVRMHARVLKIYQKELRKCFFFVFSVCVIPL